MTVTSRDAALRRVHMFWHGAPLSRMERLSIASFLANGHGVDLYVYDTLKNIPAGTVLRDAAEILPRDALFTHQRTGSVAPFADWFRYKLLRDHGGLWVDTDMVCLRPLEYAQEEIFGWQDERLINNAVLGLSKGHAVAAWLVDCCEHPNRIRPADAAAHIVRKLRRRWLGGNRRDRVGWGEFGPKGLTAAVKHFGLTDRALPLAHFYPVASDDWQMLFRAPAGDAAQRAWHADTRAVHLWNNMTRQSDGFDKNAQFPADSPFEILFRTFC